MLCTLYQIQVTMTIFSPVFCSALVRACTKQHISSYKRSRESKKVSTKPAGSPPDWLSAPASQSQSATHPLPLLYLHYEEQRAWDCLVHTPAGCRSEQNPRSCLYCLTAWPHHLTKSKQPTGTFLQTSPPPTSPGSPWWSTMQNNHLPTTSH